jgi:hypothetical protein
MVMNKFRAPIDPAAPRFAVVAVIRNEADMLESFARYHLQFAAGILLIDHRSTDASRTIVAALQAEGLPVELRGYDDLAFDQARFINAHAGEAVRRFRADWVLPLDLDELLAADDGGLPTAELVGMDRSRPVQLPWRTYVPTAVDTVAEPCPPRRIRHRLVRETVPFHKVAVPSRLLEDGRYQIAVGNHDLLDRRTGRPVAAAVAARTHLAHFPVRNPDQFSSKVLVGWLSTLAKGNRVPTEADHWKAGFDRVVGGVPLMYAELEGLARTYWACVGGDQPEAVTIEDPVNPDWLGFGLTMPGLSVATPVANALRLAEELAAELGERRSVSGYGMTRRLFRLGRLTVGWR